MPESCSAAELVELNCLPNLIQKFDSMRRAFAVLLSNLIPEFSSARQKHDLSLSYFNFALSLSFNGSVGVSGRSSVQAFSFVHVH